MKTSWLAVVGGFAVRIYQIILINIHLTQTSSSYCIAVMNHIRSYFHDPTFGESIMGSENIRLNEMQSNDVSFIDCRLK